MFKNILLLVKKFFYKIMIFVIIQWIFKSNFLLN